MPKKSSEQYIFGKDKDITIVSHGRSKKRVAKENKAKAIRRVNMMAPTPFGRRVEAFGLSSKDFDIGDKSLKDIMEGIANPPVEHHDPMKHGGWSGA